MKAQQDTKYALIQNNKVAYIYEANSIEAWNENDVTLVPCDDSVYIGQGYKDNAFVPMSIEEAQANKLQDLIEVYNELVAQIDSKYYPTEEVATWEIQAKEAQDYLTNKIEPTLIKLIAEQRGESLESFAQNILDAKTKRDSALYPLLAQRQGIEKRIKEAKSLAELNAIDPLELQTQPLITFK